MPLKKKIYPMLEKIDLKAVPEVVLAKTFDFLNTSNSALEIAEMTARHNDFIQGVTTGEKVAASILLMRDKVGGAFTALSQLQGVAYFTEDKVKTLLAVFYVETGVWELTGAQSKSLPPEPVLEPIAKPLEEKQAAPMAEPLEVPIEKTRASIPEPIYTHQTRMPVAPLEKEKPQLLDPQLLQAVDPKLSGSLTSPTAPDPLAGLLVEPPLSGSPVGSGPLVEPVFSGSPTGGGPIRSNQPLDNPPPNDNGPNMENPGNEGSPGEIIKGGGSGSAGSGGSGLLGGKQVIAELFLSGRLANASPKVSFKGYTNELSFLSATPLGSGKWRLLFKTNFNAGTPSVPLRLDFEERASHVLAVSALWNPQSPTPIVVSL